MSTTILLEDYLDITLSDDKMEAYMHFLKFDDTFQCRKDDLEGFLLSNQIKFGVNHEVLREITHQPQLFTKGPTMIASGKRATNGKDGHIKVLLAADEAVRPQEQEDGSVDLKEINQLNNVKRGQRIAERFPASNGVPGMNVLGELVAGKDGKEARFKIGKNVVSDDAGVALYAAIDGLVVRTEGDRLNVFPVYEVNGDVDYRTGNIDFVGTVVIRGNVLTGFKIKASGDIRIYGGVEGAQLEALGSIEVIGGIIAGNKGYIHARQQVKCSFVQEARISAGTDVIVSQSIMHSQVRAGRQVICNGTKGLIVGGTIQAGERVEARTVGNGMSTVTVIEVGVVPETRNELQELRVQYKNSMDNLEKTEKALRILDQFASTGQLTADRMEMRHKLNTTKKSVLAEQADMRERIFDIEKMLEDTVVARVDVNQTIYGGTKIVIGRYTRFVKDVCKRATFRLIDGEVNMSSL
ncbi:FapA family protein [Paenibacillus sp. UMB4589-SE434]|uniref:DUF342 domain-containing protein n=1 Tax=Paenibacillus sp. UMB4589-SE434 TaxID=3046314 RepID=UPI00254E8EFE|nr:FapA family protein [Paenibacillus sp. UMB4589-SE434]MDK8180704.1 FapA family protein [Paenibacillus sp. UMB4589-SE434]